MPSYKWATAHEWLAEYAKGLSEAQLYHELMELASKLDSDTIQDIYQSDMSADGYFEPLTK
jgi:hypothetical protein